MIRVELLDLSSAVEIDPLISNDGHTRLQDEAQDAGYDFEVSARLNSPPMTLICS